MAKKFKVKKTGLDIKRGTEPSHPSEARKRAEMNDIHGDKKAASAMKAYCPTPMPNPSK